MFVFRYSFGKIVRQSLRTSTSKNYVAACNYSSTSTSCAAYEQLQALCRRFAQEELKPVAAELDRNSTFPQQQLVKLAELGLMGMTAAPEHGGAGLDVRSVSLAVEELARGCASTAAILSIHNMLYVDMLAHHGNAQQKEMFLNPYTRSGVPGAFALSEPDAGSDAANVSTTATQKGNCYILNGSKSWVTSGYEADYMIVLATIDRELGWRGITAFIVPLNADGIQRREKDQKMGVRALTSCTIDLCDVAIPSENVIGPVGGGFKLAMQQLGKARIGIASQAIGIGQAALDTAIDYATCRRAFKKRIVDFQAVQIRLARMATQTEAARLLVRQAAELSDRKANIVKSSAMAKLMASEAATFSAHQCIQIMGGMGFATQMPAERYYRDARVTEIYSGVNDIQMLVIAEELLRESGKVKKKK